VFGSLIEAMTFRAFVSLLTVLLLSPIAAVRAAAQDDDRAPQPAVRLSVNLERLKQKLAALPASDDERSLLALNYYLEVYGRAPRINLLEGFDAHIGPSPFGAPSHDDMRAIWTPEEFSSPVANLGSLFNWLSTR
jgi:hypothetical protein